MTLVRRCGTPCLILLLSAVLLAQSSDEQLVRSAEKALASAETRSDPAIFKLFLAADWITVTPDGGVLHKDEVVKDVTDHEGERRPYRVELSGMRVDLFGDTAVASFTREYHGESGEAEGRMTRESVVDVFTKVDGKWKVRFSKGIPVAAANTNSP